MEQLQARLLDAAGSAAGKIRDVVAAAHGDHSSATVAAAAGAVVLAACAGTAAYAVRRFVRDTVKLHNLDAEEYLHVGRLYLQACLAHGISTAEESVRRVLGLRLSGAPRCGIAHIDPRWLERALAARGMLAPGTGVASVKVASLEDNRGLRGVTLACEVKYCGDGPHAGKDDGAPPLEVRTLNPRRLIFKTTRYASMVHRYDFLAACNHREAQYYASTLERAHGYSGGVRVLHASSSAFSGDTVILMEDLRHTRPRTLGTNLYTGNQVWGIPEAVRGAMVPGVTPEMAVAAMFARAADMHSAHFRDRSLLSQRWLRCTDWLQGKGRASWTLAVKVTAQMWEQAKAVRGVGSACLSARLAGIIDASLAATSWEWLQARLADPTVPFCLTHGDFHNSNALLSAVPADAANGRPAHVARIFMLDWPEVGVWEPTTELGQLMISDVPPAVRREHEKALVRGYWQRLTTAPGGRVRPEDFPFERCWSLYGQGGVQKWIFFFALLAAMPLPDAAVAYFHDQLLAFIDDHAANAPMHGADGSPLYPLGPLASLGKVIG